MMDMEATEKVNFLIPELAGVVDGNVLNGLKEKIDSFEYDEAKALLSEIRLEVEKNINDMKMDTTLATSPDR